jgi:predicted amidohydrolase
MEHITTSPKIALIQLQVGADKHENLERATTMVDEAAVKGNANIVVLPVRAYHVAF